MGCPYVEPCRIWSSPSPHAQMVAMITACGQSYLEPIRSGGRCTAKHRTALMHCDTLNRPYTE
eukprot:6625299-Pyramimonas_sp.AAC.1